MTDEDAKSLIAFIDGLPDGFAQDDPEAEACFHDGVIYITLPSPKMMEQMMLDSLIRDLPAIILADMKDTHIDPNPIGRFKREMEDILATLTFEPIDAGKAKPKKTYPNSGHFNPRGRRGRTK